MLDHRLVDRATGMFLKEECDLVTNVWVRTFPKGQSVEVVSTAAFRRAGELMRTDEDREHGTLVFYRHEDMFRVRSFRCARELGEIRLCVDTPEDLELWRSMLAWMDRPQWEYDYEQLADLHECCRADMVAS